MCEEAWPMPPGARGGRQGLETQGKILPSFCIHPKVARRGILGKLKPEGWPQGCLETYMQKYACTPPSSSPGSSLLPSGLGRCLCGWHRVLTFP